MTFALRVWFIILLDIRLVSNDGLIVSDSDTALTILVIEELHTILV